MNEEKETRQLRDLIGDRAGDDPELLCPYCGGNNPHLFLIEVFTRPYEGAETGTHYTIPARDPMADPIPYAPCLTIDLDMSRNPSRYRDATIQHFVCENGCPPSMISFIQHKGLTIMRTGESDADIR